MRGEVDGGDIVGSRNLEAKMSLRMICVIKWHKQCFEGQNSCLPLYILVLAEVDSKKLGRLGQRKTLLLMNCDERLFGPFDIVSQL